MPASPKLKISVPPVWCDWAEKRLQFLFRDGQPDTERLARQTARDGVLLGSRYEPRLWLPSGHLIPVPAEAVSVRHRRARLFDDASSQFLENTAGAPVSGAPFTMAGWCNTNDDTIDQDIVQIQDKDAASQRWWLQISGSVAGDPVDYWVSATTAVTARTTTGITAGTWHHAAAVEASATDHKVYLDGGSVGTNTTSRAPAGADSISIGRAGDSTPDNYFSGDLAEIAVWDAEFAAATVAQLALGLSPLLVHGRLLVFYCPIIGNFSPEIDVILRLDMTVTGAVKSAHPRMFYPNVSSFVGGSPAAASTGFKGPITRGVIPF